MRAATCPTHPGIKIDRHPCYRCQPPEIMRPVMESIAQMGREVDALTIPEEEAMGYPVATQKWYLRGHEIECVNNRWVYSDTREPTAATYKARPCGHCGELPTREGHDACLGTLKGVMNACCGHGKDEQAYIQFWGGSVIYGKDTANVLARLKTPSPGDPR